MKTQREEFRIALAGDEPDSVPFSIRDNKLPELGLDTVVPLAEELTA